ncbi:MAG: undecaprenyl diphosphate synthase family protein [Pirellulales bacterium]
MNSGGFTAIPGHIGVIPDGNRRWAEAHGLPKHVGYAYGLAPALELMESCAELGISEMTFYGFTHDNTKRATVQRKAFQQACIEAVHRLSRLDVELLVVGDTDSRMFPSELTEFTRRRRFGRGGMKVNLLVNYSWQWDLNQALSSHNGRRLSVNDRQLMGLGSEDVSRIDLVIRWGGRRRLSGFLPIQTVYADLCVIEALWPDYERQHLETAMEWYQVQDVTLGG